MLEPATEESRTQDTIKCCGCLLILFCLLGLVLAIAVFPAALANDQTSVRLFFDLGPAVSPTTALLVASTIGGFLGASMVSSHRYRAATRDDSNKGKKNEECGHCEDTDECEQSGEEEQSGRDARSAGDWTGRKQRIISRAASGPLFGIGAFIALKAGLVEGASENPPMVIALAIVAGAFTAEALGAVDNALSRRS